MIDMDSMVILCIYLFEWKKNIVFLNLFFSGIYK